MSTIGWESACWNAVSVHSSCLSGSVPCVANCLSSGAKRLVNPRGHREHP